MKKLLISILSASALFIACSSDKKTNNKRSLNSEGSQDASGAESKNPASGEGSIGAASLPQAAPDGLILGVADNCEFYKLDSGESCFECIPKSFPINHCMNAPEGFDPASNCRFNSQKMICTLGAEEDTMDFKESSLEKMAPQLPVIAEFGKTYIEKKGVEGDEKKAAIMGIDYIKENAVEIIKGKDLADRAKKWAEAVKAAFPDVVDDAAQKVMEEKALETFNKLNDERRHGKLDQMAVVYLALDLLDSLPAEIKAKFKRFDLDAFRVVAEQYKGKEDALLGVLAKAVGGSFGTNLRMRLNLTQ